MEKREDRAPNGTIGGELTSSPSSRIDVFVFADCVLDPNALELQREGTRVRIEPQVFDVLAHLIARHGNVVSKDELRQAVWKTRHVGESAITSRIKAARRAVGDDGTRQHIIRTVRGHGYQVIADVRRASRETQQHPAQEIRYCTSADGTKIAYATSGAGPPLVKAANWLSHLDVERSNDVWSHWIDELSARHTLVRYDERGCGLSDHDVGEMSFEAWVDDLAMVVDDVGLDRFPLLGISQGGAVAIEYAARNPQRVSHLVLVGAYARGRLIRAETDEQRAEAQLDLDVARVAWEHDDVTYRQVFASQFMPDAGPQLWQQFNDLQHTTTSVSNVTAFLDVFARIDVTETAPQVRCPTLILHARRDLRVPVAQARELTRLIPDSRLRLLDSANHIISRDEPAWTELRTELETFITT